MSIRTISTVSSAQLRVEISSYFFAFTQPTTTAPETSCLSPRTTESETVTTATRIRREAGRGKREAGSQPTALFVERHFDNRRWNALSANFDLQRRSFGCKPGRDVCSPDRNSERRTQRSASDLPTRVTAREH